MTLCRGICGFVWRRCRAIRKPKMTEIRSPRWMVCLGQQKYITAIVRYLNVEGCQFVSEMSREE